MQRIRNHRGVAMITVLFVGAALTVVATTATFVTAREFQASLDDRQGASSLGYAEAGIDRVLLSLRGSGSGHYGTIRLAGCNGSTYTGTPAFPSTGTSTLADGGFYEAGFTVWPQTSARCAEGVAETSPRESKTFAIISTGCLAPNEPVPTTAYGSTTTCARVAGRRPEATSVVRQLVRVRALDLPIGLYGDTFRANGRPNTATNISVVSRTVVSARDNMSFTGEDPFYFKSDFYPCIGVSPPACYEAPTDVNNPPPGSRMPAAAHSLNDLECSGCSGPGSKVEHRDGFRVNCSANGTRGTAGQSVWDGSGAGIDPLLSTHYVNSTCTGFTGTGPPRSNFTQADVDRLAPPINEIFTEDDFLFFKQEAKSRGLYCLQPDGTNTRQCTRLGADLASEPVQIKDTNAYQISSMPASFIAYFDYPNGDAFASSNKVEWQANVVGCADPNNTTPQGAGKSVIIIVRNGSVDLNSNGVSVTGAVIATNGYFDASGNGATFHGSVIAKEIRASGGVNLLNSPCWVANIPGPFLNVTATTWNQIDR